MSSILTPDLWLSEPLRMSTSVGAGTIAACDRVHTTLARVLSSCDLWAAADQ